MKLIVTAPILLGGEHQEVGTEIEVPEGLARDLIAGNKAARIGTPQAAAAVDDTTLATEPESAAAKSKGKAPA